MQVSSFQTTLFFFFLFFVFLSFFLLFILFCSRFLDMSEDEKEGLLNKHRFLVQTKIISDEHFERISAIPQSDRLEEVLLY